MTSYTFLASPKGGSGVTVTAATLAVLKSRQRPTVLVDLTGTRDCYAVLGLPDPHGDPEDLTPAGPNLWVTQDVDKLEHDGEVVVDYGLNLILSFGDAAGPDDRFLLVLRGPDYLGLRRLVRLLPDLGRAPDGLVILTEDRRALGCNDAAKVTGLPVLARIPVSPTVARCVDAGLLGTSIDRLPGSLRDVLDLAARP